MAYSFNHSTDGFIATQSLTLLYGPTAAGKQDIVFSGTFSNIDDTNQVQHNVTLKRYNGTVYTTVLNNIPVPYGGSSKCPKIVLLPGESLYVSSEVTGAIECSLNILSLS
ncbi:MAG TPA: hypothetical protein VN922_05380 [Bacteroidia bacterium]|nr:hypothetical protein [Bacteroidia bacterium]